MSSSPHVPRPRRSLVSLIILLVSTVAGAQVSARSAPLLLPSAIAYDSAGSLYIAEAERHTVRRVDVLGNISSVAGDGTQGFAGDGGPAVKAELNGPQGLAIDLNGNLFIADSGNNRVRRVDAATGIISTAAGQGTAGFGGDGGTAIVAALDLPRAVCLDAAGSSLYVADTSNYRVRLVNLATGAIVTFAGNGVQGFSGDGGLATAASLDSPSSLAVDRGGDLYIADTRNQRVRRVAADTGLISTLAGTGATGAAVAGQPALGSALAVPRGLITDGQGNLLITDSGNHRLLRVDHATGILTVVAGGVTQSFSGDGAPAIAAALDSPRAVALSPAGLVTIADSGNQRVRQLLSAPGPETTLQTIAGLGTATPGVLSISAPSVVAYGSGRVTVSLHSGTPAAGQITFLDVGESSSAVFGRAALSANAATVSLAVLPAGQHRLMATFAGDATHAASQTSAAPLTISPLPLRATAAAATMIYGSALPRLQGSLDGLLAQDAGRVSVSFTAPIASLSPVGTYAIAAALAGEAAANYILQADPANLVITQAASSVLLRNESADGSFAGTLDAQVTSSTSGVPGGLVTLMDNGAALQRSPVNAAGLARFTQLTLPAGMHVLAAAYAGDQNFFPSASASFSQSIAPASAGDFTLTPVGSASQLLLKGGQVNYTLTVQMTGSGVSSPIALTVSGLPAFTKAWFNPGYVPPAAAGATNVVLTISSLSSSAMQRPRGGWNAVYAVLALSLPMFGLSLRRAASLRGSALAFTGLVVLLTVAGCGDRVNTTGQNASAPVSYTLTVTGTATDSKGTTLQHTGSVVLTMNAAP